MKGIVVMLQGKETKGTFVFDANRDDAPITTLYLRKFSPLSKVAKIRVTIESLDESEG